MPFKFDLLVEIQVPRPWVDGKERERYHEALEQAVFADQMGFDTLWMVEHHFLTEYAHSSAPDVFIGAVSQRTERMRMGFGVTLLPGAVNHPIRVAERMATADIVTDGRVEVGTGRSSSPFQLRAFGANVATTREEWEESIRLLPRLWTETEVTHHGQSWSWDDKITVVPRPVQRPHPPLWVAATQPATCGLAGEKGVGLLLPAIADPASLKAQVDAYWSAAANPVDPVGHFNNAECALMTLALCNRDDDRARVIGGTAGVWYQNVIRKIYKDDWAGTPLEQVPDSYRYHAELRKAGKVAGGAWQDGDLHSADELIDSGAFCMGDPKAVIERVERYRAAGGTRLVCLMGIGDIRHEDVMESLELFGKEIIPHFREQAGPGDGPEDLEPAISA